MTPEALDVLFTCIANRRRRLLIEAVTEQSEPTPIEAIVEYISERENGATTEAQSNDQMDWIEIALLHNHLPKLDSAGVIEVDHDERTVRKGDRFGQAVSLLGKA